MARREGFGRGNKDLITANKLADNILSSFSTLLSLKPQAKYMSGARTIIRVNGDIAAFAFQVTWSAKTEATEIYTIDDPLPWELAPKQVEVTGTLGMLQVPGQSPQMLTMQSDIGSFLMNKYITIEVRDSSTDATIFRVGSAMITGQQGDLSADQIGRTILTWKAVGWQSENPPKQLSHKLDF